MLLKNVLRAGAAGLALMVGGMMVLGCGEDLNYGTGDDGGGGTGLVGEWLMEDEDDDSPTYKWWLVFKSNGEMCYVEIEKYSNIWIEYEGCQSYRTEGQNLYFDNDEDGEDGEFWRTYTISGNKITITNCWNEYGCEESTGTRSSVSSVKNSLSTVYSSDPALHGQDYLAWYLSINNSEVLEFGTGWSYGGQYYLSGYYEDETWYTSGNRLFLLGLSCNDYSCAIQETVELQYSLTGSGDQRRLTIQKVLPNGSLGSKDVWIPRYYYGGWSSPASQKSKSLGKMALKRPMPSHLQ